MKQFTVTLPDTKAKQLEALAALCGMDAATYLKRYLALHIEKKVFGISSKITGHKGSEAERKLNEQLGTEQYV